MMVSIPAELFCVAWIFFFGATLGSFLNVVIFRLPRHRTLLGSSHCPFCERPIAFYDNIPIVSWLMLRGRCRHCCLKISPRYPLVEFLFGSTVLLVATGWIALAGSNVPGVGLPRLPGFAWQLFDPSPLQLVMTIGHIALLALLLAGMMIEFDRQPIPRSMLVTLGVVATLLIAIAPTMPKEWQSEFGTIGSHLQNAGAAKNVAAMILGGIASLLVEPLSHVQMSLVSRGIVARSLIWALTFAALGWSASLSVLLLVCGLIPLAVLLNRTPLRTSLGLLYTAIVLNSALWSTLAAGLPAWPWALG